ncbi:unnamed protein product [Blepharisma stoltei]|uniref:Uncharacterized protein n=1 Tax=Blepharisma stoltei TaxID=1481888 RepID=A0AAU9IK74_9CILI|nr:unnamed protein product [Blepharisma stoltei]
MWNQKASCKITQELDFAREHLIHQYKLGKIKSRIDNKPPRKMPHVFSKAKKGLKEEERLNEMQHTNHLLLQKLLLIDTKPSQAATPISSSLKSLNRKNRIEELTKISEENRRILRKINTAGSHYNARKLDQDYRQHEYLAYQLSENARRIPSRTSYTINEILDGTGIMSSGVRSNRTLRPNSAYPTSRRENKFTRPQSANDLDEF